MQAKKPESGLSVANFGISTLAVTKDESEKIRKLQMQIAVLKKQKHKEDESNKRLNILKDELEKSKQEYEKRFQHLQAFHPNIEPDFGNDQVSQSRVKALESQVSSTVRFYCLMQIFISLLHVYQLVYFSSYAYACSYTVYS